MVRDVQSSGWIKVGDWVLIEWEDRSREVVLVERIRLKDGERFLRVRDEDLCRFWVRYDRAVREAARWERPAY